MIALFQTTRTARATLAFFLVLAAAALPASLLASGGPAKPAFPVAGSAVRPVVLAHPVPPAAIGVHPGVHPGAERRALLERIGATADVRELLDIERRLSDIETHSGR